jgi:hypothetical protein
MKEMIQISGITELELRQLLKEIPDGDIERVEHSLLNNAHPEAGTIFAIVAVTSIVATAITMICLKNRKESNREISFTRKTKDEEVIISVKDSNYSSLSPDDAVVAAIGDAFKIDTSKLFEAGKE